MIVLVVNDFILFDFILFQIGPNLQVANNVKIHGNVFINGIDIGKELRIARASKSVSYLSNNPMFLQMAKQRTKYWNEELKKESQQGETANQGDKGTEL